MDYLYLTRTLIITNKTMLRDLQKEKQDKNKKDLIIFIILLVLFIPISLIY
jgi:hypothetical protein